MNPMANSFGNGIFALDLHSVVALEEWRAKNGKSLPQWLESLAEWDALNSFAHFHYTHSNFAFPTFTEKFSLKATNLGHPLIPGRVRVNNDFALPTAPQVMIITGANMAGKSTFLRAVGVNFVLSLAGAPVCASQWEGPIAALRSGMRTTDSLQDHQSYFYAELARLQSIVEELKSGKPMLVLLDEILKGTNSDDKQSGSRELIHQLIQLPALVLLATHDVVLGGMSEEDPNHISATCFESEIKNDGLHFDYRLKPGVAKTRNATFLMRQMGIIPKS
jgi:DNA mismatch repair ATPase MutS